MGGWHEPYGENGYARQAQSPLPGDTQLAREQVYSPSAWNGLTDADTTLPARPAAPSWDQAYQAPTLPQKAVNGKRQPPAGNGPSSNGAHGGAHTEAYAAAAQGQITQIPQQRPSQGPARKGLDDDDEMNTTSRMARIARAPDYAQVQRKLASRRRARAALSEIMLLLDIALSVAALMLVTHFQNRLPYLQVTIPFFRGLAFRASLLTPGQIAMLGLIVLTGWPVLLSLFGLYSSDWSANLFAPIKAAAVVALSGLIMCGALYILDIGRLRYVWLAFIILDAALVGGARIVLRPLLTRVTPKRRVLIVGTGRLAVDTARAITGGGRHSVELVGVVGPEREIAPPPDADEGWQAAMYGTWVAWRLGDIDDIPSLIQIIRQREIDLVLIALAPRDRQVCSWIVSGLASMPVQVCVVPDVIGETAKALIEVVDGMPIIGLTESAISGWKMRIKRLMDLAICIPALLILAPVLLVIAVLIRVNSPGPALFLQERVGQHNRRFKMIKFRTMYVDAEQRARDVAVRTEKGLVHKRRDDPRITPIGAFLRRTSLDELPQLLNVLKGDMSIVGPRPEMPWIVERYHSWQYRRLLVPQGITGWWQVHGRSDRVLHLHTQDDIYYVRNYSLWLDIKILLMTVKVVLTGKGAF